jgi:isocitrate dehydrogenase
VKEFNLKEMCRSPGGTIAAFGGVIFRRPSSAERPAPGAGLDQAIIISRHAYGDQYRATDFRRGKGTLKLIFIGDDGTKIERDVFHFPGSGVGGRHNLDVPSAISPPRSVRSQSRLSVYLSTRTPSSRSGGRFEDLFQESTTGVQGRVREENIFEHRHRRHGGGGVEMVGRLRLERAKITAATCSPTVAQGLARSG